MDVNQHIEEQKRINIEEQKRQSRHFHYLDYEPIDTANVLNCRYLKKSQNWDPNTYDKYTFEFSFHLNDDVKDQ